jgi:hypothetical protein
MGIRRAERALDKTVSLLIEVVTLFSFVWVQSPSKPFFYKLLLLFTFLAFLV